MQAPGFFSTDFYEQIVKCQEIVDNLTLDNFEDSLLAFASTSNRDILKTVSSSLLNRIKIKPQDADLIIDFIERHDQLINQYPEQNGNHQEIMPIFTQIVNPTPLHKKVYNMNKHIDNEYGTEDRFNAIPVSECFIFENLRQRGHIVFDLQEYQEYNKKKEKMPHLFPDSRSYEVNNDFSFVKTIQYIHLMPNTDYADIVARFDKNQFSDDPMFREFHDGKLIFRQLSQNNFEQHKKYLKEGFNPSKVPTLIREDNIEEFAKFASSQMKLPVFYSMKIYLSIYDCNVLLKDANFLEYAAYYGSAEIFKYINQNAPNLEELYTENTQNFAVIGGNEEIFEIIDDYFTKKSMKCFEKSLPFSLAFHHKRISDELIAYEKCCINTDSYKPEEIYSPSLNCFYYANWRDMTFIISNNESNIALFLLAATMFNNDEMFENLIEMPKINLNIKYDRLAPINYLVRYNNFDHISMLLDKGKLHGEKKVDIKVRGFYGFSPVIYSCVYQLKESFNVLIEEDDADVNEVIYIDEEVEPYNLMYICLKFRQFEMARMVLNHKKFDINTVIGLLTRSPVTNNLMLALNYLIEEKKRGKKKYMKRIDVSGLEE